MENHLQTSPSIQTTLQEKIDGDETQIFKFIE